MDKIEEILDKIGVLGSINRIEAIQFMNLGERSDAAKRVINKRYWRKELMDKGLTFEESCLTINNYYNNDQD